MQLALSAGRLDYHRIADELPAPVLGRWFRYMETFGLPAELPLMGARALAAWFSSDARPRAPSELLLWGTRPTRSKKDLQNSLSQHMKTIAKGKRRRGTS